MIDKSTPFLSREAKIGDVLAVTASLAVIAAAPIGCWMAMVIGDFKKLFIALHASLPFLTRLVLMAYNGSWIPMLHLLVAAVVVLVLFRVRNHRIKVAVTATCLVLSMASIAAIIIGIALPFLDYEGPLS